MGKRVTVTRFDDLEPELDATEHITFAWEGVNYEIDLSTKNAARFKKEMDTWIKAATRVAAPTRRRSTSVTSRRETSGLPLGEIRQWAKEQGYNVADKGQVSAEIKRAWKAAHETEPETPNIAAVPAFSAAK